MYYWIFAVEDNMQGKEFHQLLIFQIYYVLIRLSCIKEGSLTYARYNTSRIFKCRGIYFNQHLPHAQFHMPQDETTKGTQQQVGEK